LALTMKLRQDNEPERLLVSLKREAYDDNS